MLDKHTTTKIMKNYTHTLKLFVVVVIENIVKFKPTHTHTRNTMQNMVYFLKETVWSTKNLFPAL